MSDLIERQAAIDALADYIHNVDRVYSTGKLTHKDCMDSAHSVLDELPSAEPEWWIPCSERLPEDDTLMLVNYIDHRPDAMDIWIGWHEMENVWYIDGEAHSREFGNEVIAWMPLPESYKGEQNG